MMAAAVKMITIDNIVVYHSAFLQMILGRMKTESNIRKFNKDNVFKRHDATFRFMFVQKNISVVKMNKLFTDSSSGCYIKCYL